MIRYLILTTFSLAALLTPVSVFCAKASARPHLVLFIADDLSWHDIGPYGAKDVRTPHLDRLATQSLKFTHAFATSPTCTPSRCAMFTGLYPFRNGAHANHSWINEGVKTLPHYMQQFGYRVVIAGKTHIGPREQFAFEYLKGSNVMPPGKRQVLWTDLNTTAVDEVLASHDKASPLCLLVCSHSPHVYWPENEEYDAKKIGLPPYLVDTPQTREVRTKYYTDVTWMDKQVGDVVSSLAKHGFDESGTIFLFTADQGAQWPFAKWNLYDAGIKVPLLVRWRGKVKANSTTDVMVSLVDVLPTLIDIAGGSNRIPEGKLDGKSLLPVLISDSNRHHDAVFATNTGDGQMNQSPMRCVRTRRYKYVLNLLPNDVFRTHISDGAAADGLLYWKSWESLAKTDAHAKLMVDRYRHRPAEELYDVRSDPYELHNLAGDRAHADELVKLRALLHDWRVQQGEDLNRIPLPEDGRKGALPYAE